MEEDGFGLRDGHGNVWAPLELRERFLDMEEAAGWYREDDDEVLVEVIPQEEEELAAAAAAITETIPQQRPDSASSLVNEWPWDEADTFEGEPPGGFRRDGRDQDDVLPARLPYFAAFETQEQPDVHNCLMMHSWTRTAAAAGAAIAAGDTAYATYPEHPGLYHRDTFSRYPIVGTQYIDAAPYPACRYGGFAVEWPQRSRRWVYGRVRIDRDVYE